MIEPRHDTFSFGPFLVDATERVLLRHGKPVPLTPKAFATLLILLDKAGHVIEKDELVKALWPDTYVEEANVAQNIFKLRRVLGTNRLGEPYIETVPRRGYRFLGIVKGSKDITGDPNVTPSSETLKGSTEKQPESETIKSIAVLPLTNDSPDKNAEYLSDGITESIINSLSRLAPLRVMAHSSVFSYKNREVDPKQVGRELNVDTVLTGKVIQLSDCLVIRVELVDAATGWQIWGEQYSRKADDILKVQEEISREVSAQLSLKLTGKLKKQLGKRYTENVEAYRFYLKGRFLWNKHDKRSLERSIRCFKKAIHLDPNYALAFAGMADSYQRLSNLNLAPRRALPKARAAAAQSLALDNTLAEAHAAWGWIKIFYDHDWQGAEIELKRAIDLNPGAALTHQRYGTYLTFQGRFEESLTEIRLAQELDPLGFQNLVNLATTLSLMKKHGEAIRLFQHILELEPNYRTAHYGLGCAFRRQANFAAALREFEKLYRMESDSDLALGSVGHVQALSGNRGAAERILAELLKMAERRYVSPYSVAIIHIGLNNKNEAFDWMEKLYKDCNDWLVWLRIGPEFDPLRTDPRFDSLLRRVGFAT